MVGSSGTCDAGHMVTTHELPTSGWLLGRLVEALRLRAPMEQLDEVKVRTTCRYLSGDEQPKPETRAIAVRAFIEVLLVDDLLPEDVDPNGMRAVATEGFVSLLAHWDEETGLAGGTGWKIARWDHAYVPWLRLLLLDVTVRAAAVMVLRGWPVPSRPCWSAVAEGKGLAKMITNLGAGKKGFSGNALSRLAGVSRKTITAWMKGRQVPQSEQIEQLAHALAEFDDHDPVDLGLTLRVAAATVDAVEVLRANLGDRGASRLVEAFASYLGEARNYMINSDLQGRVREARLWQVVLEGARTAPEVVNHLAGKTLDQQLHADLTALITGDWGQRVLSWYRERDLHQPEAAKAHMAEMFGESDLDIDEFFEEVVRLILLPAPLGLPDQDMQWVRMSGDTDFKRRNREQQFSLASHAGDHDDALLHARRLVELDGTNAKYRLWLGATLSKLDQVDEALLECRIGAQLDPTWCMAAAEVGVILLDHGRGTEALPELEGLLAVRPPRTPGEAVHVNYTHGVALMRAQEFREAAERFRAALEDKPEHPLAMDLLAHCLFALGARREALVWAKKAFHGGQPGTLRAFKAGVYDNQR